MSAPLERWPRVAVPGTVMPIAGATTTEPTWNILDDIEAFLRRFIAFPSEDYYVAVTLWIAHTHVVQSFESTPRLAILSPEPASGKSRVLEVIDLLVPRPLHAVNATPAALFRTVSDPDGPPTILYDEIDTVFGPKAKDNEDVRGMLNSGHRRGASALRCVTKGNTITTEEFPSFCAVALAGLGDLPDTIMTRSVVIPMRRRGPGEIVEPFRHRQHAPQAEPLRQALEEWAVGAAEDLVAAWPELPKGIEDRAADVWEPLLAVADNIGGTWPERARVAAVTLVTLQRETPQTLGLQLLTDVRDAFTSESSLTYVEVDTLLTSQILDTLISMDESPWADLHGKPLDARGLARLLSPYGIEPRSVRVGEATGKGYRREDMHDAWARYLPPATRVTRVTRVTDEPPRVARQRVASMVGLPVPGLCRGCEEPMTFDDGTGLHPTCEPPAKQGMPP